MEHFSMLKQNLSMRVFSFLSIVVLIILITSCSLFETNDNAMEPTALEDINNIVTIKVKWSNQHGVGSNNTLVKLSPVLFDKSIVVIDREANITAYNQENGSELWHQNYATKVSSGLAKVDDKLFFSDDAGILYALSVNGGQLLWKQKLSSVSLSLIAGDSDMVVSRTIDGNIFGLNSDTGEERWVSNHNVPILTYRGNSSPIFHENKIYVALDNAQVIALNIKNGQTIWSATVAYASGRSDIERMVDIDGDPVIVGNNLYAISLNGNIAAIDVNNGKLQWTRKVSSFTGIAHDEKNLYITDENSQVLAIRQDNGAILWKQDKLLYRRLTQPEVYEGYIFVADFKGIIHIMSKQSGALIGRKDMLLSSGNHDIDHEMMVVNPQVFNYKGYLVPPIISEQNIFWYGASGQLDRFKIL
ncbi:MAG: outer membrane protein assembly factor BamB [Gammaproteobacteria bacterium]|nr:outer membrane protein assembly factor BamB [Gammaproteobacteria bacterium]